MQPMTDPTPVRPAGVSPHVRLGADLRTMLGPHAILKAVEAFAVRQGAASGNPAFTTACLDLARAAANVARFF